MIVGVITEHYFMSSYARYISLKQLNNNICRIVIDEKEEKTGSAQ